MLKKEKSLYQVKLILGYLPKEEYALIPQEIIQYVDQNAEYDENIKVNPQIPLEQQDIDIQTYAFLEKMLDKIDSDKKVIGEIPAGSVESMQLEISKLKQVIEQNKVELQKIPEAKSMIEDYQHLISQKDETIMKLTEDNVKLRSYINNTPGWIRKFFMKDVNLMLDGK